MFNTSAPTQKQQSISADPTNASLAEAAASVSDSIVDLAKTEQAANPVASNPSPDPSSYGMGTITSVDWSGPVEPLINQLAKVVNYKVKVVGHAPVIPVIVTVSAKNEAAGSILQSAAYQCGKRADVVVYPNTQTIELRYAGN